MDRQISVLAVDRQTSELAAGILLFDLHAKQVLLIQDAKGAWRFPSGRQEKGETSIQAAVREVREETGIQFDSYTILDVPIPMIRRKAPEPGSSKIKLTTLYPAYLSCPRSMLPGNEHESKCTPRWFSLDEASSITKSKSRAASLTLASQALLGFLNNILDDGNDEQGLP